MGKKRARNLNHLFHLMSKEIEKTLMDDVAKEVKKEEKKKIEREVYDKYEPTTYERKYDDGGLSDLENMEAKIIKKNTLSIQNIRRDEENNRLVAPIVESGKGYTYDFKYNGISRPFTLKTAEELKKNGAHIRALKSGLIKRGFRVK